jgi:sulfite reductase (ferredoxin)
MYKAERAALADNPLQGDKPEIRQLFPEITAEASAANEEDGYISGCEVMGENKAGLSTIKLQLALGDISADDLLKVAKIAEQYARGIVRTTQYQDLLITSVPSQAKEKAIQALKDLSIDVTSKGRPEITACTGAATCKLGLCLSRGLADAISEKLSGIDTDEVIRISGCPNSCGHHFISDIGFQGKAKRVGGKLMPFYDVLTGAVMSEGKAKLAETIGTVPAKRIPDMLAEALANGSNGESLKKVIEKYSDISGELPDDYYFDYDSPEPFSLAGRGPGECGAGVMDVIKVDIDEAADAIEAPLKAEDDNKKSDLVYKTIVASTRALLVVFGLEPKKDREIFKGFEKQLIEPGWVKGQTKDILEAAIDWRMGERETLCDLAEQVKQLSSRVKELFLSLDASLKFRAAPAEQKQDAADKADAKVYQADLRGVACPLNFVKAKLELEKIDVGQELDVLLDAGDPVRNVPASFTDQGHEVRDIKQVQDYFIVRVLRKK